MAHIHSVLEVDPFFNIDAETRAITYLGDKPPILIQGDHNSEIFSFELPRFIEGHDMSLCNIVQVHYININSGSKSQNVGIYEASDFQIDPSDEDTVIFTWLISQSATFFQGTLNFAIRFACVTGEEIDYNWSTGIYSAIQVVKSINNVETFTEQYTDILQKWYEELVLAGEEAVEKVYESVEKSEAIERVTTHAINAIESAQNSAINQIANAEATVMEEEREELINEIVNRIVIGGIDVAQRAEEVSF